MTDSSYIGYYVSCERRERELAAAAGSAAIAAIHLDMATHYSDLIANYHTGYASDISIMISHPTISSPRP